jgi:Bacterial SCP ortholog
VPPRRRDPAAVTAAVAAVLAARSEGRAPARPDLALAVRGLADRLAEAAPGKHVEARVPPYTAVQCVEGPRHTRGTPPNVVEADAVAFVELCTGRLRWSQAVADGRVRTWGDRADLSPWLPLSP